MLGHIKQPLVYRCEAMMAACFATLHQSTLSLFTHCNIYTLCWHREVASFHKGCLPSKFSAWHTVRLDLSVRSSCFLCLSRMSRLRRWVLSGRHLLGPRVFCDWAAKDNKFPGQWLLDSDVQLQVVPSSEVTVKWWVNTCISSNKYTI